MSTHMRSRDLVSRDRHTGVQHFKRIKHNIIGQFSSDRISLGINHLSCWIIFRKYSGLITIHGGGTVYFLCVHQIRNVIRLKTSQNLSLNRLHLVTKIVRKPEIPNVIPFCVVRPSLSSYFIG